MWAREASVSRCEEWCAANGSQAWRNPQRYTRSAEPTRRTSRTRAPNNTYLVGPHSGASPMHRVVVHAKPHSLAPPCGPAEEYNSTTISPLALAGPWHTPMRKSCGEAAGTATCAPKLRRRPRSTGVPSRWGGIRGSPMRPSAPLLPSCGAAMDSPSPASRLVRCLRSCHT